MLFDSKFFEIRVTSQSTECLLQRQNAWSEKDIKDLINNCGFENKC